MATTTEIGDAFRDQIVALLKISGFEVTSEIISVHKKVDIRFEARALGRRRRYALEAKKYKAPLVKDDLVKIVADYEPLLHKEIDEILIVSPFPVRSASANAYLASRNDVTHRSFLEFQEDVMGFDGYLRYLIRGHEQDGLEHYYVPPQLTDSSNLSEQVAKWLDDVTAPPIAILAGYGMGKTSFARHLAYHLASERARK